MLKARVITAILLLAIFLPVTLFAPMGVFAVMIAFVVFFAAWEWARLLRFSAVGCVAYATATGFVLALSMMNWMLASTQTIYHVAAIFWLLVAPFALMRKSLLIAGPWRIFLSIVGVFILLACWQALLEAREMGVSWLFSMLLIVWIADIGAYFVGRKFGRHKLAASISAGKTWEGALAGAALVLLMVGLDLTTQIGTPNLFSALHERWGWPMTLLSVAALVACSVMGDLFESLLKRQAGMKDSSALLPGHGGVLDRIDALLPVVPLAMLLLAEAGYG